MNSNRRKALAGLFAFALGASLTAKAPSFLSVQNGAPSQTEVNLRFNPPTSLNISCPADPIFPVSGASCAAAVVTLPSISTQNVGCSGAVTLTATSPLGAGFGPFWNVAAGDYAVVVKAKNDCGDEASCTFIIRVRDQKKPQANVVQTLFSNVSATGDAKISARMFDQNSIDNCSAVSKLRFSFSQNPSDSLRSMTCDSLGERTVKIFVHDEAGNFASKTAKISIADPLGACQTIFVAGKIADENGQPVGMVELKTAFDGQILNEKSENGTFLIDGLPAASVVSIEPAKKMNPLNGVSSYDLSLLSKHILGQQKLDSPFKMIAADVNRNGSISTADLLELRKMILGELSEFPANDSWRFVPSTFQFSNPAAPFAQPIAEKIQFLAGSGDVIDADFVGIKIGDLNGSANAQNAGENEAENRSPDAFLVKITDQKFEAGDDVEAVFSADLAALEALQATLLFDANSLIFNELEPSKKADFKNENFSEAKKSEGKITFAWHGQTTVLDSPAPIFKLKFRAAAAGRLSDFLSLGEQPTRSEAYSKSGETSYLKLIFEAEERAENLSEMPVTRFELAQNWPNPMAESTQIRFETPVAEPVFLKITEPSGRVVFEKKIAATIGSNSIELSKKDLAGASGLLFYSIRTSVAAASRSMLVSPR